VLQLRKDLADKREDHVISSLAAGRQGGRWHADARSFAHFNGGIGPERPLIFFFDEPHLFGTGGIDEHLLRSGHLQAQALHLQLESFDDAGLRSRRAVKSSAY
jgi:hypothetical protein